MYRQIRILRSNTSKEVGKNNVLIAWKMMIGSKDLSKINKHSRHQSGNR